jgi:hypothetical protein
VNRCSIAPGLGQRLAEGPDRVRIRHRIAQPEAEEPHPGEPVAQVELGALVGQAVLGLQDQDLEHQDVIERWPAALRAIRPRHGTLELGPEHFEVDHSLETFEVVTLLRQTSKPLLDVEQSSRPTHPIPPHDPRRSRSDHAPLAQVFGGLQLIEVLLDQNLAHLQAPPQRVRLTAGEHFTTMRTLRRSDQR